MREILHLAFFLYFVLIPKAVHCVEIFSDSLVYKSEEKSANFKENVKVLFESTILEARNLDVIFGENGKEIASASAYGSLRIYNDSESATAKRASYDGISGILLLQEDVLITRDSVEVKADRYEFDIEKNASKLSTNPSGRVRVIIDSIQ